MKILMITTNDPAGMAIAFKLLTGKWQEAISATLPNQKVRPKAKSKPATPCVRKESTPIGELLDGLEPGHYTFQQLRERFGLAGNQMGALVMALRRPIGAGRIKRIDDGIEVTPKPQEGQ